MKWKNNKIYPNILQSIANNESNYISLAQELTKTQKVFQQFVVYQWYEEEIPIDDWESWHELFRTDEYNNDELEVFTDPILYDKGINFKPKQEEYPVIVTYTNNSDASDSLLYWQSIKLLKEGGE